jgi:plastocyanin
MPASTEPSRLHRLRGLAVAAAAGLLVVGLGACGDDDDVSTRSDDGTTVTTAVPSVDDDPYGPGGTATDGGDEAEGDAVKAVDFSLTSATVGPGSDVRFENRGETPHTMTADDGSFDSGRVEPGGSTSVTAPEEPGDYAFHCEIHPAMTATLTVES